MDKIAHIKAEIERRMKLNSARAEIDKSSSKQGAANEDEELLAFIDFLPEEPVSSIWHDANEEPDMDARIVTLHEGNVISTTRRNYLHGMKRWNPDKWCYLKDILEKKEEPVKQSVDEAMAEVEEKAKLFTEAHKGESADEILSKMRGEEPVSEELEEFANKYAHNLVTPELYGYHIVDAVKAGAQWQKQQDQSTIELAEDHAMLAGMEKMKEEMMTKSIEAVISQVPCSSEIILYNPSSVDKYYLPQEMNKLGLNKGDKIKVIIIKDE